jgi:hypothetical protein
MGALAGLYLYMPPSQHGGVVHPMLLSWADHTACEHIDAVAGGSFFALSIQKAHKLVKEMASN